MWNTTSIDGDVLNVKRVPQLEMGAFCTVMLDPSEVVVADPLVVMGVSSNRLCEGHRS